MAYDACNHKAVPKCYVMLIWGLGALVFENGFFALAYHMTGKQYPSRNESALATFPT